MLTDLLSRSKSHSDLPKDQQGQYLSALVALGKIDLSDEWIDQGLTLLPITDLDVLKDALSHISKIYPQSSPIILKQYQSWFQTLTQQVQWSWAHAAVVFGALSYDNLPQALIPQALASPHLARLCRKIKSSRHQNLYQAAARWSDPFGTSLAMQSFIRAMISIDHALASPAEVIRKSHASWAILDQLDQDPTKFIHKNYVAITEKDFDPSAKKDISAIVPAKHHYRLSGNEESNEMGEELHQILKATSVENWPLVLEQITRTVKNENRLDDCRLSFLSIILTLAAERRHDISNLQLDQLLASIKPLGLDLALLPSQVDNLDEHILSYLVESGQRNVLKIALAHGLDPNITDRNTKNSMWHMIRLIKSQNAKQAMDLLWPLMEKTAHAPNISGVFPVHAAVNALSLPAVMALDEFGADFHQKNNKGLPPFSTVQKTRIDNDKARQSINQIFAIIEKNTTPIDQWSQKDKDDALFVAARLAHPDLIKACLKVGANPHPKDHQQNALLTALSSPSVRANSPLRVSQSVKLLLKSGINVNDQMSDGSTALHLALANGLPDVALDLLRHGSDITIKDNLGLTPALLNIKIDHLNKLAPKAIAIIDEFIARGQSLEPLSISIDQKGSLQTQAFLSWECLPEVKAHLNSHRSKINLQQELEREQQKHDDKNISSRIKKM